MKIFANSNGTEVLNVSGSTFNLQRSDIRDLKVSININKVNLNSKISLMNETLFQSELCYSNSPTVGSVDREPPGGTVHSALPTNFNYSYYVMQSDAGLITYPSQFHVYSDTTYLLGGVSTITNNTNDAIEITSKTTVAGNTHNVYFKTPQNTTVQFFTLNANGWVTLMATATSTYDVLCYYNAVF